MLSSPLLTIHEVADLLKVKEATIRAWIQANDLRAIKFGREWRVARKDLEAFLNAHANKPEKTAATGGESGARP
jgi:excisionase family DNA binding protein